MRIAAASRPCPGEQANGDGYLIAGWAPGIGIACLAASHGVCAARAVDPAAIDAAGCEWVLIALIDGIGHGPEAAAVTERALGCLERDPDRELRDLVVACHDAILHSRGAALGLVRIEPGRYEVSYVGVGSVGIQVGVPTAGGLTVVQPLSSNGIVGYNLPSNLMSHTCEYLPGGLIVLHTDGIAGQIDLRCLAEPPDAEPSSLARAVLRERASQRDDATVIVVRSSAAERV